MTDPWLVDGAFEGAWCHYPPLQTQPADVASVDALFISHLHPDHCDEKTLASFRRDIPIVVLDHGRNFLHRGLARLGFTNLIAVPDGGATEIGPFKATLYAPFSKNVFCESEIGNLIDAAIVLEHRGISVFNANDNTLDEESAREIRRRHGRVSVAQLNYNAAGPYPSCFDNLTHGEKESEHARLIERNIAHFIAIANILEPRYAMPFAGAYVLGGKNWQKNRCLGTTSPEAVAERILDETLATPLLLNELQSIDLATGKRSGEYRPIVLEDKERHIAQVLSHRLYPHESDPEPSRPVLIAALHAARANLWQKQVAFGHFPDLTVEIRIGAGCFRFSMRDAGSTYLPWCGERVLNDPSITVSMDRRLLMRIATGLAHWNNAEIGGHIDFDRRPNRYVADFHTMMSFFTTSPAIALRASA